MADIPFPNGYVGVDDLPKQRENLINIFMVDNGLVRTPGIDTVVAAAGDGCRGATTWLADEKPYFVLGTTLFRLESDLTTKTSLGTIPGTADCILSGGQVELVILIKGGAAYTYSSGGGLSQITDPDYVSSVSVDFIDGRHVFIPADGSPAFYSEVDDAGNIDSLSFFDAEELPDQNKFVINIKNSLQILGGGSSEIFRPSGNVTAPFRRSSGSREDVGYVSGGIRYSNTFMFIGRERNQSYAIYTMLGEGRAQQISNSVVTEDLNDLTSAQIEACKVNRFKWLGVEFVAFTIADRTFTFSNGQWIFLDSVLNGTNYGAWRVNGIAFAYGRYYVGDTLSNNIGVLTDSPSEYGSDIEYQIDTFYRAPRNSNLKLTRLELDCLTGQNGTTVGLALSRDGRVRGDYDYKSLGAIGNYQKQVRWQPPGGLIRAENYAGISIRGTGPAHFSVEGIQVD